MASFVWGPNGERLTPEQAEYRRRISMSLAPNNQQAMDQGGISPLSAANAAQNWGLFGGSPSGAAPAASGSAAGGSAGASGPSGGFAALGPVAAIAAAVAASKAVESNQGDSDFGKVLGSLNAPSLNQIKEDPKLGLTTALGIPFVNGFIRNDKAAEAKPEWQTLFGL